MTTAATAPPPCSPRLEIATGRVTAALPSPGIATRSSCASCARSPAPTPTATAPGHGQLRRPQAHRDPRLARGQPRCTCTSPRPRGHGSTWSRSGSASSNAKPSTAAAPAASPTSSAAIRAFIDGWNDRCHPFVWTKTAEQILAKADRQEDFRRRPTRSLRRGGRGGAGAGRGCWPPHNASPRQPSGRCPNSGIDGAGSPAFHGSAVGSSPGFTGRCQRVAAAPLLGATTTRKAVGMRRKMMVAAIATVSALALAACGSSTSSSSGGSTSGKDVSKAASAADAGGMDALVAAAKKEGQLNVITLPDNWANYGTIMKTFTDEVRHQDQQRQPGRLQPGRDQRRQAAQGPGPRAGRARPGTVVRDRRGQGRAARARTRSRRGTRSPTPPRTRRATGSPTTAATSPSATTRRRSRPRRRRSPTCSSRSTRTRSPSTATRPRPARPSRRSTRPRWPTAASFDNIQPGVDYFKKLKAAGNFVPVTGSAATVQSGQTPILIWWDYLQESSVASQLPTWKVVIPSDASYAALLRPGDQRDGSAPGRRPAVGGVPLLHRGPEPVAQRLGPPDPAATRWSRTARSTRPPSPGCPRHPAVTSPSRPTPSRPPRRRSCRSSGPRRRADGRTPTIQAAAGRSARPAPLLGPAALRALHRAVPVHPVIADARRRLRRPGDRRLHAATTCSRLQRRLPRRASPPAIELAIVTSVVPGVLGLLIAYAVQSSGSASLRRVVVDGVGGVRQLRRSAARVPLHRDARQHGPGRRAG